MKKDIEKLGQAEEIWARSLVSGDARLLATIIDGEFSFIGPDGELEDREVYLAGYEALSAHGVVVESVDLHDVSYRVLGDIGIVTGRALARVLVQSQPMTEDVRFTRVYRRSEQGWLMVAGQGTRVQNARPPSESGVE
jgi:ketosteroid isomerase-like protein